MDRWRSLGLAAMIVTFAWSAPPAGEAGVRAAAVATFPEFLELLAIPDTSSAPAELQRNAEWLKSAFSRRGFASRLLENGGKPLVFAEHPANRAGRPTLLFYLHFDGQPVLPAQWAQKDPFQPVVKRRDAGGAWAEVDRALLLKADFDPELRVFARAASDDKGPILMFLAACDLLRTRGQEPACNVKVILDSEEEVASPGLPAVVARNLDLLKADGLVIVDGPMHPSGRPTLVLGNRGIVTATLTVFGPKAPLHSGHYGNYVPNPAQRLATLLASMKDDQGRVTVAGYYDRTRLGAEDRALVAAVPDDEAALRRRVGIAVPDAVGGSYQEALQYPSLNVRGLASAAVGSQAANIVPHLALAELDLRTTQEADAAYLVSLLRKHIEAQGYHLVTAEPTDQDRAAYPKLARLEVGPAADAARQPADSPIARWAGAALAKDAPEPVRIRQMGGTVPTHQIVGPLGLPFVLVSMVNADNNQHTFDENLRMGNYLSGIRSWLGLLSTPYP